MGIQKGICRKREKERGNQGNVLVGYLSFLVFLGKNRENIGL